MSSTRAVIALVAVSAWSSTVVDDSTRDANAVAVIDDLLPTAPTGVVA
jgi:hypothetical protein